MHLKLKVIELDNKLETNKIKISINKLYSKSLSKTKPMEYPKSEMMSYVTENTIHLFLYSHLLLNKILEYLIKYQQ
jgi:hypothetical protein